ncbi:MAG: hypothetical protein HYT87_08825 [Nitrospirae bacterium]|nr:hypothetical protein [Nitrospirota bacterium]
MANREDDNARDWESLRRRLLSLVTKGKRLMVGATAMQQYVEIRPTADLDYLVDDRIFANVEAFLGTEKIPYAADKQKSAFVVRILNVDVIRASSHPVLEAVLKVEGSAKYTTMPSPEALAALKYVALVSPTRPTRKKRQDRLDFGLLAQHPDFSLATFRRWLDGRLSPAKVEAAVRIVRGEQIHSVAPDS